MKYLNSTMNSKMLTSNHFMGVKIEFANKKAKRFHIEATGFKSGTIFWKPCKNDKTSN